MDQNKIAPAINLFCFLPTTSLKNFALKNLEMKRKKRSRLDSMLFLCSHKSHQAKANPRQRLIVICSFHFFLLLLTNGKREASMANESIFSLCFSAQITFSNSSKTHTKSKKRKKKKTQKLFPFSFENHLNFSSYKLWPFKKMTFKVLFHNFIFICIYPALFYAPKVFNRQPPKNYIDFCLVFPRSHSWHVRVSEQVEFRIPQSILWKTRISVVER